LRKISDNNSFWFIGTILAWVLILVISFIVSIFTENRIVVRISEYGSILYILLVIILSLFFRKKYPLRSRAILKGLLVVFIVWFVFIIIFSIAFFIGFKYF
jgi:phosphatidylglycerophosphate synthase